MRIFVAGATGTLGRPVVRLLTSHRHEVFGLTRSATRRTVVEALGAHAVIGDALDEQQMRSALLAVKPDVVLHLLTALPPAGPTRPAHARATNEVRTTGTRNLLRAAIQAGAKRLVAESFVAIYGSTTGIRATEDAPLPPVPHGAFREVIVALRSLEQQLRAAAEAGTIETVALRIGFLYGPEVPSTEALVAQAKAGRLFAPRDMPGIGPFVHIADAASAIVAAVERPASLVYNIVDDEPMSMETFVTLLTRQTGAAPPRRLPGWLVRIAAPLFAELGSANLLLSNAKAKQELGWTLRFPAVADGLRDLAARVSRAA